MHTAARKLDFLAERLESEVVLRRDGAESFDEVVLQLRDR